jgi:hypothetical protein
MVLAVCVLIALAQVRAGAQPCVPAWAGFGAGDLDDIGYSLAIYDAGSSPQLYAGGEFFTAGGVDARHAARWTASAGQRCRSPRSFLLTTV